jgi:hypothetical protein
MSAAIFQKDMGVLLVQSILDPRMNETVVFKDFFTAGLCMPPHPVLVDILCKFHVQLHQLTPNAIVQIGKFISAVTSCGGHPTAYVFTHHYELHHQNKKIHLEGSKTTLAAQFGYISFHPSQFRNRVRLTPAVTKPPREGGSLTGIILSDSQ